DALVAQHELIELEAGEVVGTRPVDDLAEGMCGTGIWKVAGVEVLCCAGLDENASAFPPQPQTARPERCETA
ncbi:MAG: hypothetical protein M3Y49_13490, partial [Actinomycetota bacterium]|nr:hypothetical protein [Actinomycetota bacterium]